MINFFKKYWFKVLMWGLLILVIYALIVAIVSEKPSCGYDDVYDNNCELIY